MSNSSPKSTALITGASRGIGAVYADRLAKRIGHVGLRATNPAASAEFYRDVLGMEIVGGSTPDHPLGATAFVSSRPDEESHEIALFADPAFAHVAFKVSSLAELRSSTHALWRGISRSSSHSTTARPSRSISTTQTAT